MSRWWRWVRNFRVSKKKNTSCFYSWRKFFMKKKRDVERSRGSWSFDFSTFWSYFKCPQYLLSILFLVTSQRWHQPVTSPVCKCMRGSTFSAFKVRAFSICTTGSHLESYTAGTCISFHSSCVPADSHFLFQEVLSATVGLDRCWENEANSCFQLPSFPSVESFYFITTVFWSVTRAAWMFFFPTIYRHVTIRHQASARPLQSTASSVEVRGSTSRTEWLSPSTRPPTHLGLLYLSVLPAVLRSEVQNFVARINFWGGLKICFIIVIILIKWLIFSLKVRSNKTFAVFLL